jgi:hypothetical protein
MTPSPNQHGSRPISPVKETDDSRPPEYQEHRSENTAPRTSLPSNHSSARRSISAKEKVLPKDIRVAKQAKKRSCVEKTDDGLTAIAISTWTFEVLGLVCGVLSMLALIVILKHYEDKPEGEWKFFLHINTVVSILSTISTTTLATPIESGLSQMKWVRYKGSKPGVRLDDLDLLDEASRGTVGRANLLLRGRGGQEFSNSQLDLLQILIQISEQLHPSER